MKLKIISPKNKIKKRLPLFIFLLIIVSISFLGSREKPFSCNLKLDPPTLLTEKNLKENYEPFGYVAHAFGPIDGEIYTNSKEAFEQSYQKGFRIFEVDLILLKNGTVFCAHEGMEEKYDLNKKFSETTIEELKGKLCLGKYTPLTGSQLLDFLNEYKDAHVVADTKYSHPEILKALVNEAKNKYPSVLKRIIPHIKDSINLCEINQIYPFKNYILALYRSKMTNAQILGVVKKNKIGTVMMMWDNRYTDKFKEKLNKAGAVVYVHSLNDPEKIAQFKEKGVGVYSDGYFPKGNAQ